MKGKLIVIEGTSLSGKKTQSSLLVRSLNQKQLKAIKKSFPDYDSPTGKIIKDCLLNKDFFQTDFSNIDPKVSALYYAADRLYNINKINDLLNQGINVIVDRYVESNMAYQAAKYYNYQDKINTLLWMEHLEFNLLELPKPDLVIFLYLPYEYHQSQKYPYKYSKNLEQVYSLMAERYNFKIINCLKDDKIRSIDDIHNEIYNIVSNIVN